MIEKEVKGYYSSHTRREWGRLYRDPFHQLEWKTTWHYLERYMPKKGLILDAGGGPGRYSVELAKKGYRVVLFDLVPEFIETARKKARKEEVLDKIQFVEGTVERLPFEDNTFDSVLCLGGVMSHLVKKRKRMRAAEELVRVLKPGKPLFVSVIGKLDIPMLVTSKPDDYPEITEDPDVFFRYCTKGDYYGGYGFAPSHFYDLEELEGEFKDKVKILKMVGLEGVFSPNSKAYNRTYRKHPELREVLWKLHLSLCENPHIAAISQHFMLVGRKPRNK